MQSTDDQGGRLPARTSERLQKQLSEQLRAWAARFPDAVPGRAIDYAFRPGSYWLPLNAAQVLANVKGATRKRAALELLAAGRLEHAHPVLLTDTLNEEERTALSRIHPTLMGGEYLPDFLAGEVEIARMTMASTTQDVVSIRARPVAGGISYRIVDEYSSHYTPGFWLSAEPLALAELIHFIDSARDHAGPIGVGYLDFKVREEGQDVGGQVGFLEFSSQFYPGLGAHYDLAIHAWAAGLAEEQR